MKNNKHAVLVAASLFLVSLTLAGAEGSCKECAKEQKKESPQDLSDRLLKTVFENDHASNIFDELVSKGASIHTRSGTGPTAGSSLLHYAAPHGNMYIVQALIKNGLDKDIVSSTGSTPLMCAAETGRILIVEYLLMLGADADKINVWGNTALHYAAEKGYLAIVQRLVEHGARTDLANYQGNLPIDLARIKKHEGVVKYLKSKGSRSTACSIS